MAITKSHSRMVTNVADVINLEDYGATTSNSNQSTSIQAALDVGGTITGSGNTYRVDNTLNLSSNTTLKDMTLDFTNLTQLTGSYRYCVRAVGDGLGTSSVLTANATESSYSVEVTDGSIFTAESYVQLTSEDFYPYSASNVKRGEIKKIKSVSSNTVTFYESINDLYTTSNTATLRNITLLENITLDNVKIIGTNTENHKNFGLDLKFCENVNVRNSTFKNSDLYGLVINFNFNGNYFDGVQYTGSGTIFYGISLENCCQWGNVYGNRGEQLRHLVVTTSSSTAYGQPYFITIDANVLKNAMAGTAYASWAFEHHGFGRFTTWINNIADSCYVGMNIEGSDIIVANNIFRNCAMSGIYFDNDATLMENILVTGNLIAKTTEELGGTVYGIYFPAIDDQDRKNIVISNNIIDQAIRSGQDFGIRVKAPTGGVSPSSVNCRITGNTIRHGGTPDSTDYGIYLDDDYWLIDNNEILGYERGILVTSADNVKVLNNSIRPTHTTNSNSAISISGTSNNATVVGNVITDAYRSISINTGVTNAKVAGNTEINSTTTWGNTGTNTVAGFTASSPF